MLVPGLLELLAQGLGSDAKELENNRRPEELVLNDLGAESLQVLSELD